MPRILRKVRRLLRESSHEADIVVTAILDHLALMGTPWLAAVMAIGITGLTLYGVVKVFAALSA
jgi:hypothetical protein